MVRPMPMVPSVSRPSGASSFLPRPPMTETSTSS